MQNAVLPHSMPIEVEEGYDGACERNAHVGSGRGKERKDPQEIAKQNEDGNGPDNGDITERVMSRVLLTNPLGVGIRDLLEENAGQAFQSGARPVPSPHVAEWAIRDSPG